MGRTKNEVVTRHLTVGENVRVKGGVTVPEFEDIPLGGWTGTVIGIERADGQTFYEIEWDRRTLDGMHPVYRKRCVRNDCEFEFIWLGEDDIEPHDGTPLLMEQPARLRKPVLTEEDQDDRVRRAFGLTHDDPLPEISQESLCTYHSYLVARLKFPFRALRNDEELGSSARKPPTVTITGLRDPDDANPFDEDGLICVIRKGGTEIEFPLAAAEVKPKHANFTLLSDYAYWLHNWPWMDESEVEQEEFDPDLEFAFRVRDVPLVIITTIGSALAGGILGTTIGAALLAVPGARLAAILGGALVALLGACFLAECGSEAGEVVRLRFVNLVGGAFGLLIGGLLGMALGLTIPALPWSLVCSIAGMLLVRAVVPREHRAPGRMGGLLLGACVRVLVAAFRHDQGLAIRGMISGGIAGLLYGAALFLALIVSLRLLPRAHNRTTDDGGDEPTRPMRTTWKEARRSFGT